jgi:hypothetical protein
MAIKTLVITTDVDHALKAHNCQANAKHRITRGNPRLKVKNERSWDHYCLSCAVDIVARDLDKLRQLQTELHTLVP